MEEIKVSTFGSAEEVARINACTHEWDPCRGFILGNRNHVVSHKCVRCGTFKNEDNQNGTTNTPEPQ